jgi:hypothetical protein
MADSNLSELGYVEESVFGTTPSAALNILRTTGGTITPTQNTVLSEEIRADLRAGRPVRTSQMAQGDISVEWSYGTLDTILEGMLMNSWDSESDRDVLVDGVTKKSYTFEDRILDVSPSVFRIFRGSRIASLNMDLAVDSIVSGSFGVMSAKPTVSATTSGTGSPVVATTTGSWNTVDMIEALDENNVSLTRVIGLTINMDRNLREKREFGNINPWDIGVGRLLVTGNIQLHFTSSAQLTAWNNFSDRSLEVEFQDEDGNQMIIEVPKLKYVGEAEVSQPGVDEDRILTLNWEAYANAGDEALIKFSRIPV